MNNYYKKDQQLFDTKIKERRFETDKRTIPYSVFFDCQEIYDHFGESEQREKFKEEIREFVESEEDQELVDLWVVATQLIMNNNDLRKILIHKLIRTKDRIAEGYYAK